MSIDRLIDCERVVCVVGSVMGVTQLRDVVYIVCSESSTITTFCATTHQRLRDIDVEDFKRPWDIAACEQTSQLYVADCPLRDTACIWRVSADATDIKRWLPESPSDTFTQWKLSVTSSRLLVTTEDAKQLTQFDEVGNELIRVRLPDYMYPSHAVESPTGTFIVSHRHTQLKQYQVSEVNTKGQPLRQFIGPTWPPCTHCR